MSRAGEAEPYSFAATDIEIANAGELPSPRPAEALGAWKRPLLSAAALSIRAGLELLPDALTGFRRKLLRHARVYVILAFAGGGAQERQLFAVPATPFAEQEVHPKPELLEK